MQATWLRTRQVHVDWRFQPGALSKKSESGALLLALAGSLDTQIELLRPRLASVLEVYHLLNLVIAGLALRSSCLLLFHFGLATRGNGEVQVDPSTKLIEKLLEG